MKTKEVLAKLEKHPHVIITLNAYNARTHHGIYQYAEEARHYIYGYVRALVDTGVLTERERGVAYLYFVR